MIRLDAKNEREEKKENFSLREKPYVKEQILELYGSLQYFWDQMIQRMATHDTFVVERCRKKRTEK